MKETLASKTKLLRTEQSRSAALQEEKNSLTTELASSKAEVESLTQRLNDAAAAAAAVGAAAPPPAASEAENQENNNKLQVPYSTLFINRLKRDETCYVYELTQGSLCSYVNKHSNIVYTFKRG